MALQFSLEKPIADFLYSSILLGYSLISNSYYLMFEYDNEKTLLCGFVYSSQETFLLRKKTHKATSL